MLNRTWENLGLKYCPVSTGIHFFLVSESELTQICYSFLIVYVSYIEAKKQSITFKYTLISAILNPKYFSTSH